MSESTVRIGTCSWKYDAWRGLVYSQNPENYLQEYAKRYDCVEVDQWFWSLYGPDREGIEERTGKDWSRILEPRDADLDALVTMLKDIKVRRQTAWVFANNHFEGCAPLTIDRIRERAA